MQSKNRLFDDVAKLGLGLVGIASGVKQELKQGARQKLANILKDMDLVTREEYKVTKAMLEKTRSELEALKKDSNDR